MPNERRTRVPRTIILLITFFSLSIPAYAKYSGGTGEPNDPYQIGTAEDLMLLGDSTEDYDKHFILMADIDLDPNLPGRKVFDKATIAHDPNTPFVGVFNGKYHTISHLTINGQGYLGLFGQSGSEAEILDLCLEEVNVHGTGYEIGGLVGNNEGNIINCHSTGTVNGEQSVGGLVGYNRYGTITDCHTNGNVTGYEIVGGLVGLNGYYVWCGFGGPILNCSSSGSVTGTYSIGGLVGENPGAPIMNCYATNDIFGEESIGGLVGYNADGLITNCYSTGTVVGDSSVGGLIGRNSYIWWLGHYRFEGFGKMLNCYTTCLVNGNEAVGGLVGSNEGDGEVHASFWNIQTSGLTNMCGSQSESAVGCDDSRGKTTAEMQRVSTFLVWGICGNEGIWTIDEGNDYPRLWWENKPGQLISAQLSDFLTGAGTEDDPYLIYNAEQLHMLGVFSCEWDKHFKLMADIDLSVYTGTDFNTIGYWRSDEANKPFTGVFDGNDKTITSFNYTFTHTDCFGLFGYVNDPNVQIKDLGLINPDLDDGTGENVGCLVGFLQSGTITECYIEGGSVSGGNHVGGLVGNNGGSITTSYSTSSVSGTHRVGGLIGVNSSDGNVTNCYSHSPVRGIHTAGGLVGINNGPVTQCYTTGEIRGESQVGGLVGSGNPYRATDSFWDMETSGQAGSSGGVGLTTAEMMDPSMIGLNGFANDPNWVLDAGHDYPRLAWEGTPGQIIPEPTVDWMKGEGTPEAPYRIETADQLIRVGKARLLWEKHFILGADIDMNPNLPGRYVLGQSLIPTFTGVFEGNGHAISHITIMGESYLGLFGRVASEAEVKDLGVVGINITCSNNYVGGLVGHNDGTLTRCYSIGTINGSGLVRYVGVLVGLNYGDVIQCYSMGAVDGKGYSSGGLLGYNHTNAIVSECYSTATVRGVPHVGGLVGINNGLVTQCYSSGMVSGDRNVGGLVGWNNAGIVTSCFWDIDTGGLSNMCGDQSDDAAGCDNSYGKTTAEMQTPSTFLDAGWDFVGESENGTEDIWWIDEGQDYPRLWWEQVSELVN